MLETVVSGILIAGASALIYKRLDTLEKAVNGGKEKVLEVQAELKVLRTHCPIFKDGCEAKRELEGGSGPQ